MAVFQKEVLRDVKQMRHMMAVFGAVLGLLAALFVLVGAVYQRTTESAAAYYARIDNSSVTEIPPSGGMSYRYVLPAYREDGHRTEMTFDTSRILKEGAYIRLESAPLRGVIGWEEVQYEDLPPAVRAQYEAASAKKLAGRCGEAE